MNHVQNLKSKTHSNCSRVSFPYISWTPYLHHGHCEEAEIEVEDLSSEVNWFVLVLEEFGMPPYVNSIHSLETV